MKIALSCCFLRNYNWKGLCGMKMRHQDLQQYENKQHGTSLLPYDIYGIMIPEYYTVYPVHWHEEMEIVIAMSGSCIYNVDFKKYEVKKGDILIIPPASLHSYEQNGEESFNGFVILFSAAMINNNAFDICSTQYIIPIFNNETYLPVYISSDNRHNQPLNKIIREILISHFNKRQGYELSVKISLMTFIHYFIENQLCIRGNDTVSTNKSTLQIKRIINYIEEHYNEKITLETLSDYAGISIYHLAHMFKKCTGQSPVEYINHYRLSMAANKLMETDEQIIGIAIDTGFNNISYFNRTFKKRFGVTPKEYRKS